jgi:hypothetical protein
MKIRGCLKCAAGIVAVVAAAVACGGVAQQKEDRAPAGKPDAVVVELTEIKGRIEAVDY